MNLKNLKILMAFSLFFGFAKWGHAQKTIDGLLEKYNAGNVPYISAETLKMDAEKYILLDTRLKKEFEVSHIPGAIWVGERPDAKLLDSIELNTDQAIVVYCTVGIRSENYGAKLNKMGFKNVQNLYGSIFAWKDAGYPVIDTTGVETENVHIYAPMWGKYLKNGKKIH